MHFENTRGQRVDYAAQRTRTCQRHSNKIIKPDRTKTISFLNRKMTERMASGWMDGGWMAGEQSTFLKDAVKMVEATVQLGGVDITMKLLRKSYRMLERGMRAKAKHMQKRISFRSIHDETTPHLHCDFVSLTKGGNLSAKDVIGDKRKWRRIKSEIWLMQERVPRAKFGIVWSRRKRQFNGLDQKLYEKDDRVHQ